MKRIILIYFFFFMGLISLSFAQSSEEKIKSVEQTNLTEIIDSFLPEIIELRLEFLQQDLSQEKLFRLASFYLSSKCYTKSAELYGLFLSRKTINPHRSMAHYNRALSLFSLGAYESSATEFWYSYDQNNTLFDSLRMLGSIAFLKKDKINSLFYWKKYLEQNTNESPERSSIIQAIALLESADFSFEPKKAPKSESINTNWPFRNPDTLPYPDSSFNKKRVI
ncbi:MAG: hypothetical protein ACRCTJ_03145 [Brevinema sp.]